MGKNPSKAGRARLSRVEQGRSAEADVGGWGWARGVKESEKWAGVVIVGSSSRGD